MNEKALTVDAKFRLTLCGCSQCFFVENLAPGMGEPFEVFVPRAADTAGKARVEVVETVLRLD